MTDPVLFRGGIIRTMDGAVLGDPEPPEAVLIQEGRVAAVGTEGSCRAVSPRPPREIDLDGRTLMPGFIDAHAHLLLHGCRLDWADLSAARSAQEIIRLLQRHADKHPDVEVIRGYGYDQSLLAGGGHPSARELDQAGAGRPVMIQHVSGHGYAVNSAVLRDSGITALTPDPPGGSIGRDPDGTPDGRIFDSACDMLSGPAGVKIGNHGPNFHLPMPAAEIARLHDLGQKSFLAAGVTTICDAQVTSRELGAYLAARDQGRLRLRAELLMLSSNLEHLQEIGLSSRLGDARLATAGVKLYADGSVIARTALLDDCCGEGNGSGYLYHDPAELKQLIIEACRLGLPTATHAQGRGAIALVLDAIAASCGQSSAARMPHRVEHCGFPDGGQITRMRELGIVPVPQPLQVHERADALISELGEYGAGFYPYGEFEAAGLPVIISSDAPVTDPAPLRAAWAAITRQTRSGAIAGSARLRASRQAALLGLTTAPARLLGRDDIGLITPGRRADLVLLDADPCTVPVSDLPRIAVTETWIDGELAWKAGAPAH